MVLKVAIDFVIKLVVLLVGEMINVDAGISWGGLYCVGGGLVGWLGLPVAAKPAMVTCRCEGISYVEYHRFQYHGEGTLKD